MHFHFLKLGRFSVIKEGKKGRATLCFCKRSSIIERSLSNKQRGGEFTKLCGGGLQRMNSHLAFDCCRNCLFCSTSNELGNMISVSLKDMFSAWRTGGGGCSIKVSFMITTYSIYDDGRVHLLLFRTFRRFLAKIMPSVSGMSEIETKRTSSFCEDDIIAKLRSLSRLYHPQQYISRLECSSVFCFPCQEKVMC